MFHLDRELLHGNFLKHPIEKRIELHEALITKESWVIDGNYHKLLPQRVSRATLVVFIDATRIVTLPRVLLRARKGGQADDTVPEGAHRDEVSFEFLKWVAGYDRKARAKHLRELCEEYNVPFLLLPNKPLQEQVETVVKAVHV